MLEIAAQQDTLGARTSYGSTNICMRQDQHLAKLVPFKVTGRCSSENVEPTLRVVIAFVLLLLFQLSGRRGPAEGQPSRPRSPAPRMRSATAQPVPRWSWCRQASS